MYKDFEKENHIWLPHPVGEKVEMIEYHIDNMVAGDTDSVTGDTMIVVNGQKVTIKDYYDSVSKNCDSVVRDDFNKNYVYETHDDTTLSYDGEKVNERKIRYVMKHRVKKKMYRLNVGGNFVTVTNDHSMVVRRDGKLHKVKPSDISHTDYLIYLNQTITETTEFSIESLGVIEQDVYDIEVDVDHNFFANDILVHNSSYLKLDKSLTEQRTSEQIVEMCDDLCTKANDLFANYCMAVFNCPEERTWTIAADREAVSDKSFFLTKKRYIMHLINMEGEWVDDLKIMGVEIKKSDTSQFLKDCLRDLVNCILDGYDRKELKRVISEWKEKFYNSEIEYIGKPSGCKKLKSAYDQLEATGGLKGVHYVARAAIFYNSLCTDRDRRVRVGDNVLLVYIDHPDSKYIGVPRDAEVMPDWLDDIIIDYKTNWMKAETKITNYLKAIGFDIESVNQSIKKDLFGLGE